MERAWATRMARALPAKHSGSPEDHKRSKPCPLLLSALSLFLYTHRRMAITGDDVSLDQIVPLSKDFMLEEGACWAGWYELLSSGCPATHLCPHCREGGGNGVQYGWDRAVQLLKTFSFSPLPQCPQMVNSTSSVSSPYNLGLC